MEKPWSSGKRAAQVREGLERTGKGVRERRERTSSHTKRLPSGRYPPPRRHCSRSSDSSTFTDDSSRTSARSPNLYIRSRVKYPGAGESPKRECSTTSRRRSAQNPSCAFPLMMLLSVWKRIALSTRWEECCLRRSTTSGTQSRIDRKH